MGCAAIFPKNPVYSTRSKRKKHTVSGQFGIDLPQLPIFDGRPLKSTKDERT